MCKFLLILLLMLPLANTVFAVPAAPPDISGTWVLNVGKSKLAKGDAIRSETLIIVCSRSKIVMRDNADGRQSTMTYYLDGKEHPFAEVEGGEDLLKAHWKKAVLVVETFARLKMPDSSVNGSELWHLQDQWSLSVDGRVLTENSDDFDVSETRVYERQ